MGDRGGLLSALGLCAAAWLWLVGCAASGAGEEAPQPAAEPAPAAFVEPLPPFALGGDEGLEIRRWVSAMPPAQLRASLAGVVEPAPLTDAMRERLARVGFALLRAPREGLLAARAGLADVRRLERVWIGQAPAWRELIASQRRVATVRVGGRMVDLRRDRPRLLIRAWQAPGENGPVVRLDLAVVEAPAQRRPLMAALGEATAAAPVVSPLAGGYVSLALDPRWAYFLVIDEESAAEDRRSASAAGAADDADSAWAPELLLFGAGAASTEAVGPPAPPAITPAQALLTSIASEENSQTCMALVFLAHVNRDWRALR